MLGLHDLQVRFGQALLGGNDDILMAALIDDGMDATARLGVYRNNVLVSLKDALKSMFRVVCRLVDERFFLYATEKFISSNLPRHPCLHTYGAAFPAFLAMFPPCRELVYLPDVARFEWLMNAAAHAAEASPIPPSALTGVAEGDAARLVLHLDPSLGFLQSVWPVDRIWRTNRCGHEAEVVDLDDGGAAIEVRRAGDEVIFRTLDAATFAFRRTLANGDTIGDAAEAAFAVVPEFNLAAALGDLFREGAVVGFNLETT